MQEKLYLYAQSWLPQPLARGWQGSAARRRRSSRRRRGSSSGCASVAAARRRACARTRKGAAKAVCWLLYARMMHCMYSGGVRRGALVHKSAGRCKSASPGDALPPAGGLAPRYGGAAAPPHQGWAAGRSRGRVRQGRLLCCMPSVSAARAGRSRQACRSPSDLRSASFDRRRPRQQLVHTPPSWRPPADEGIIRWCETSNKKEGGTYSLGRCGGCCPWGTGCTTISGRRRQTKSSRPAA